MYVKVHLQRESYIPVTIIHFKILTFRTKCLNRFIIGMDHSNIKKLINAQFNVMKF